MKKGNIIINAKKEADTVDVRLYGIISEWTDVNGNRLADELSKYEGKFKKLNIYLNSNGGSVIEGIALFNILTRTKMELSIYVDGVAASMAFVLLQVPNAKRYMAKYTRIMAHRVSGMAVGNIDDLRDTADMMEGFEEDLINIIAERTDLGDDKVKNKWFNGKDHWFNPQQALDNKLIDGIVDGKVSKEAKNMTKVSDLVNFYGIQITNYINHNSDTMDLTNIINSLGMPAGSDMAAIEAKVNATMQLVTSLKKDKTELEGKVADFKTKAEDQKKLQVKDLVENAIKAKKINEQQREVYTTLATNDFDSTKAAIGAMAAPQSLNSFVAGGDGSPVAEDRKSWTFQDWQKKDGKGLGNLKENHKEIYENLHAKAFPKK